MYKPMKIKMKPLQVGDWIGRKFVRGVYVTQELFQVDMLNRALVELCKERSTEKVSNFMASLWEDAHKSPLWEGHVIKFDQPTKLAFNECLKAVHPVVALSLLRLARIEQLHVGMIDSKFGRDMREKAESIVSGHTADDLRIGVYGNGKAVEGTFRDIFKLTGKQILKETPTMDWHFGEFLNTPYAVEADLLFPAQLIIAKCYAVKALEKLYSDKMLRDGYPSFSIEMNDQLENWRYEYLFRQTQWTFIELAGFTNVQYGMSNREARDVLNRDFRKSFNAA